MNIEQGQKVMIFKNEVNGNVFYSAGLSKKKQDGTYDNGYLTVQFKNGVAVPNKTKIIVNRAWITFYKKDNKTIPYVFIAEFEIVEDGIPDDLPF